MAEPNPAELDLDPETELTDEERSDLVEAEPESIPISYSGQDFDVDGLVRRMRDEDIKIPQFGRSAARPRANSREASRQPNCDAGVVWSLDLAACDVS